MAEMGFGTDQRQDHADDKADRDAQNQADAVIRGGNFFKGLHKGIHRGIFFLYKI